MIRLRPVLMTSLGFVPMAPATSAGAEAQRLLVSNPCFEIWQLLHFTDPVEGQSRKEYKRELGVLLSKRNASKKDGSFYMKYVHAAIRRAEKLDRYPEDPWPREIGSRVYVLMERLLAT